MENYLKLRKDKILARLPGWEMNWEFSLNSDTNSVKVTTNRGGTRREQTTTNYLSGYVKFTKREILQDPNQLKNDIQNQENEEFII